MKKLLKILMFAFALTAMFAFTACRGEDTPVVPDEIVEIPEDDIVEVVEGDPRLIAHGLEIVNIDGENVLRFVDTRDISVAAWNRSPDRMPHISQSYWAAWIQSEMMRLHNVSVSFVELPRWEEDTVMAGHLAIGNAPDVAFTFQFPVVQNYADMDGVMNLAPLIVNYRDLVPNFYNLQGSDNIWWNRDPQLGHVWAFAVRHYDSNLRMATFVRGDWLETLNMDPPTTRQEFEDMLIAFRDNATLLLGADADQMIPFRPTQDVGWTADPIITSFIPHDITDRQWYVYGFDDRRFTMPGIVDGVRVLNRWYNEGLIWPNFSLHDANDPIGDDLIMLGVVGAFSSNWDGPFRPSPGLIVNMQDNVGPHAHFIPVAPFENNAGIVRMQVPHGTDRSIFFPATNSEPVASLLYLDFISRASTREFLMFGYEDVHFRVDENGIYVAIPSADWPDEMYIPSLRNFDLLPTFNGIPPLDRPGFISLTRTFEGIDPVIVADTVNMGLNHAWVGPRAVTRQVLSEAQFGGGLPAIRDTVLNQAINATVADFDAVWAAGMETYMVSGGRAIIEERQAAWVETFGDTDWLPH